jgi:hypothetical protein
LTLDSTTRGVVGSGNVNQGLETLDGDEIGVGYAADSLQYGVVRRGCAKQLKSTFQLKSDVQEDC